MWQCLQCCGKNEIFTYVSVGFPAFCFLSIAFYLSLFPLPDQVFTQIDKTLLCFRLKSLSSQLLPIEQIIHSPIFFLDFFVQLTLAHPYLSCSGEPRDVAFASAEQRGRITLPAAGYSPDAAQEASGLAGHTSLPAV